MGRSLVAFDTDQIKDYVFATRRLREIRGASALLDRLNRETMPYLVGAPAENCIYAHGGAGLFVVDSDEARHVIQAVEQSYRQLTGTATITGVSAALPEDYGSDIGSQFDLIRHRLRFVKDGQGDPVLPLTHPLLRTCDSCGRQYAETVIHGEPLCSSCCLKRKEDSRVKQEIGEWTLPGAESKDGSTRLWERLIARLKASDYPVAGYDRTDDFGELGELSSPRGYIGLIYADGDGMGREIEQIRSLAEMRRFATVVDDAIYQAVAEAIPQHLYPREAIRKTWPFDVLLWGGDDLVIVTRAQSAVEVAQYIVRRFPELTEQGLGRPLSLSASAVICHVNYPIGSLLDLAESGLGFAKREAARRRLDGQKESSGLVNFAVVTSANHLNFREYYEQVLVKEDGADTLYRTQRPYTPGELDELLVRVRLAQARVPHAKLEQLRTAVFKSRRQGTLDAVMAVLRSRNAAERDALLELLGSSEDEQLYLPWRKVADGWRTPILDIVELLDFVE